VSHALSDLFNNPGTFVAKNNGERHAIAIEHFNREIGMTYSTRNHPNKYLITTRIIDRNISNDGGKAGFFEEASFTKG
jgi:hypothetical protein